jgi:hypothetical protein
LFNGHLPLICGKAFWFRRKEWNSNALQAATKSAIIPHTKNGSCGSSIHGIRFLAGYCAPAMVAGGKGLARFW